MDNLTRVEQFLREDDWNFSRVDDKPILEFRFAADSGSWTIYVTVSEDGLIAVDSMLSQYVPSDRRFEIAELLTRANYGKRVGGFQLDLEDGETRYHCAIDVEGGELTRKMFTNLLYANIVTMDRYFKAIMAVSYAGVSAELAHETAAAAT